MSAYARVAPLVVIGLVLAGCGGAAKPSEPTTRSYEIPSSSMEPTLHCAKPMPGCLGAADDHVIVQIGKPVVRGDVIVFQAPQRAGTVCGESGIFVKRVLGLPGETVTEDDHGFIFINGRGLNEPYVTLSARALDSRNFNRWWTVPADAYFAVGDSRGTSCDSRDFGAVPNRDIVGPVLKILRKS